MEKRYVKNVTVLLLIGLSLMLSGCGTTILNLIEKSDIYAIPEGTMVGNHENEKDGWFISNMYVQKIMEAKVEK